MTWQPKLLKLASASLEAEDRRLRLLYCSDLHKIRETPAICLLNEHEITGVIIAAIASRLFVYGESLIREAPYPESYQRADFAVKEDGQGKNWAFVEVKRYNNLSGKSNIEKDVAKLREIEYKVQRWLLLYRVATPQSSRSYTLSELIDKNWSSHFVEIHADKFTTINSAAVETNFELAFCRVRYG